MNEEAMDVYTEDWSDIMDEFDEGNQTPVEEEQSADSGDKAAEYETNAENQQTTGLKGNESSKEQPEAQEEKFTLKHLGVEKEVSREEMKALAQQGMDYARIRSQRDELMNYRKTNESIVDLVTQLAQAKGMNVQQYADHLQVQRLVAQGMSKETATEHLARTKAESALKQQTQQQQAVTDANAARLTRVRADLKAFQDKYNVSLKEIPQEVWDKVTDDTLLTTAYSDWLSSQKDAEIENLKSQLKAQTQNAKNKQTSTGTRQSSGDSQEDDPFITAFMAD